MEGTTHILALLMENEPGALSRVVGLFSQRGYNIESLSVAPTDDASLSRLTLTTVGPEAVIRQLKKHLVRLIDVVRVEHLSENDCIERELMLVKLRAVGDGRSEIQRCAEIFRGDIIDVGAQSYVVQLVGAAAKLNAFLSAVAPCGVLEVVRTGVSGISRGARAMRAE